MNEGSREGEVRGEWRLREEGRSSSKIKKKGG